MSIRMLGAPAIAVVTRATSAMKCLGLPVLRTSRRSICAPHAARMAAMVASGLLPSNDEAR